MARFNITGLPTLGQSLPGLQGAAAGQDLMRAYLQNQAQQQRNVAQPGMNEAKLAQMLAQTEGQKLTTEQMTERLGLDEYKAWVTAQNAARGLKNIDLQREKMAAYYANAMSRFSKSQPGQIAQGMDPSAAAGALAGGSGFSQAFGQQFGAPGAGGGAVASQRAPAQEIAPPNFPALQQFLGKGQQGFAPSVDQNIPPVSQAQPQIQPPQPPILGEGQQGGVTDEMTRALMDAQRSASIKATTTAQIINQRHYSNLLDDLIDRTTPNMTVAIKAYSGPAGTSRLKKDQIIAMSGGSIPPALEAFNRVKNIATQFLANEITRSLGEAHNIATAGEMRKLANPIHWTKNPALALAEWDEFIKNSKQVSKTLSHSPAETLDALKAATAEPEQRQAISPGLPGAQQSVNAAPTGTVEMVTQNGESYAVPHADVEAAIKYGWRRANG